MTHLLDTNICSAYVKQPGRMHHRIVQYSGGIAISSLVLAELYAWAFRRPDPQKLLEPINEDLLADVTVLDFDTACARQFGQLRAYQLETGILVHPVDLMIASTALIHDLTLVTHNVKHFNLIPGLRVDDWLAA